MTADLRWIFTARTSGIRQVVHLASSAELCHHAPKMSRLGLTLCLIVCPQLEYTSEVWNPHTVTALNSLEQVLRSAVRFVHCDFRKTTSSLGLVSSLSWDSLNTRRLLAECSLFHQIHHKLVCMPFPWVLAPANDHSAKYAIPKATIDVYDFAMFPRTVQMWHRLPESVILTANQATFRQAALHQ